MSQNPLRRSHARKSTGNLQSHIDSFLIDRQARALAPGTLRFYRQKLELFQRYMSDLGLQSPDQITPTMIRGFLMMLSQDHNPGGVSAAYRTLRAFLKWWENEESPDGWRNPIDRVSSPKVPTQPLEPATIPDIQAMLKTCQRHTFNGDRDKAIMLALLDTGCRAQEFLDINVGDLDMKTGQILIRSGKGAKSRTVFAGLKTRRAIQAYLQHLDAQDENLPLWRTSSGDRLGYSGLRDVVRRRAKRAGIEAPTLHSFRRAFALNCLRGGMDVFSLQRLMGHSDLTVLRRYLAQTTGDLQDAYQRSGPVDHLI